MLGPGSLTTPHCITSTADAARRLLGHAPEVPRLRVGHHGQRRRARRVRTEPGVDVDGARPAPVEQAVLLHRLGRHRAEPPRRRRLLHPRLLLVLAPGRRRRADERALLGAGPRVGLARVRGGRGDAAAGAGRAPAHHARRLRLVRRLGPLLVVVDVRRALAAAGGVAARRRVASARDVAARQVAPRGITPRIVVVVGGGAVAGVRVGARQVRRGGAANVALAPVALFAAARSAGGAPSIVGRHRLGVRARHF